MVVHVVRVESGRCGWREVSQSNIAPALLPDPASPCPARSARRRERVVQEEEGWYLDAVQPVLHTCLRVGLGCSSVISALWERGRVCPPGLTCDHDAWCAGFRCARRSRFKVREGRCAIRRSPPGLTCAHDWRAGVRCARRSREPGAGGDREEVSVYCTLLVVAV